MAAELLTTFAERLGAITLLPGRDGVFTVDVDGARVYDQDEVGHLPEVGEIAQLVADRMGG